MRGWAGTERCSDCCCWASAGTGRCSDLGRVAVAAAVARRTGPHRHRRPDYLLLAAGTGKLKAVAVAETELYSDCLLTAGSDAAAAVGTVHLPQLATAVAAMAGTADLWRVSAAVETAVAVAAERTRRRKQEELADVVARRCCRGFDSVAGAVVAAPLRRKDPGRPEKKRK